VAHTIILATQEAEIRKIALQSQPQANRKPYLENAQHKTDWWSGSSDRAPALASMNPDFKSQLSIEMVL
jgi:hypothetical protein